SNLARSEPRLRSKRGMVNKGLTRSSERGFRGNESEFFLSAITGAGISELFEALSQHAQSFMGAAEPALVTRERHRQALEGARAALRRVQAPALARKEDLLAEELRIAASALARLTGRVDVEDILDVIFRDFCIGK